jgi:tripartite-type tricarboxylate transporter receptor subunit TctC
LLALGLAVLSARAAAARPAFAQSKYPERPIRLLVPFPPGGAFDAIGRPWADKMQSLLGTVVVENQGGGGSSLGAAAVARAQPDGYNILLGGIGALVIHPLAASRPLYDPIRDFEPISLLVRNIFAIVVHPSLPVRTLQELIDYAGNNPGKLSYGSAGVGSGNHLAGELFKSLTGAAHIVHLPYRGAGPALTDLISGQIPMAVPAVSGQVIELNRSGKLRLLAVTSQARLTGAPDIPTAVEAGLSGMIAEAFVGLFAPAGTPKPIIEQIAQATHTAMADPQFRQRFIALGLEPFPDLSTERTRRLVEEEIVRWTPIIKALGLKLTKGLPERSSSA